MLIVFAGLPGVGKSTLARGVAEQRGAVYLRIDTIEQALRGSSALPGEVGDAGYRVAYAVAEDQLKLGRLVVADAVNGIAIVRSAWWQVAERAGTRMVKIEIVCSDSAVHQQRVESRKADIPGLRLPSWAEIQARKYERWKPDIVLDTAHRSAEASRRELDLWLHALLT